MKIENQSRKRSHKLDEIGVGRIRTFPFLLIPFTTPSLMIQWKLDCRSWKQKRKNKPITRPGIEHCDWLILPLLLATQTMQFSPDRKRRSHKRNRCSASDSVGLIFTTSYRSALLNCFFLLKLANKYQIKFLLQKCEDLLVAASGSISAGGLSIHKYFTGFSPQASKPEKEQVLAFIIIAQEYKLDKLLADCLHEARYFSLTELKKE